MKKEIKIGKTILSIIFALILIEIAFNFFGIVLRSDIEIIFNRIILTSTLVCISFYVSPAFRIYETFVSSIDNNNENS